MNNECNCSKSLSTGGEYPCKKLACIKEQKPDCMAAAVIPSITVETADGITNLANCLVHVLSTNTTYYVDDKHRILITWAGPVDIPGYDMETNPDGYKNQIVTDTENQVAVIYDAHGVGFTFGIEQGADVQGAVNAKIDEMAANGELADVVMDVLALRAILAYDTVADMKLADNLSNGAYVETYGFYAKGDGGGAKYKVRDIVNTDVVDNMTLFALADEDLVAELIAEPIMTTRQFGSGTNADLDVLTKALTVCDEIILSDNFTIPPQQINISSNKVIDFNNHKITMGDNNDISWANLIRVSGGHVTLKNGEINGNSEGQTVAVVTNNTGVLVTAGTCTIDSMKIHNCHYEGIVTNGICNLTVTNSSIYECGRNGVALLSWENVVFENDTFWGVAAGENISDIDVEPYDADGNMGRVIVRNCIFKDNLKMHNFQARLNDIQTMPAEILMENCKCFGQIAVGYDQGRMSTYTFRNISISGVDNKPALYLYKSKQNVDFKGTFINCAYPVKVAAEYTWDYIGNIKIDAQVKGTAPTTGIEFAIPEGAMTYPHPLDNFDIKVLGTNSIKGWKLLHNSTIKTPPLIEANTDVTLNENTFYSDIYMTGWGHYVDIDAYHNNSDHINPPFSIHTNNANTIRCTKLPTLANMGNGGILMVNGCNLGITLHNHKANNFIVDNVIGTYTARTVG